MQFNRTLSEEEKQTLTEELLKEYEQYQLKQQERKSKIISWFERNNHPWLSVQPTTNNPALVFYMQVKHDVSVGINLSILSVRIDEEHRVSSFYEVEQKALSVFETKNTSDRFELIKLSNKVAKNTRRGRANTIVCNSENSEIFDSKLYSIILDDNIDKGTAYLLYSGNNVFDRFAIYSPILDEDDNVVEHRLFVIPDAKFYGYKLIF